MLKVSIAAGIILAATASMSFAASTVGVLNPNQPEYVVGSATTAGTVQNSPSGLSNANFIPFQTFKTQVAAAFAANTGGVMDFNETSQPNGTFPTGQFGPNGTPFPVTYGVSQTNSIGISRTSTVAGDILDAGSGNNTVYASGTSYLGFSGTTTPGLRLSPAAGLGVTAVGFTILERGALRTPTVSFVLDDNSVVTLATDAIPNGGSSDFYGFQAPAGRTISVINYSSPEGALRVDDLGFITAAAAIPEPTSIAAIVGLGGVALRRRRRA